MIEFAKICKIILKIKMNKNPQSNLKNGIYLIIPKALLAYKIHNFHNKCSKVMYKKILTIIKVKIK